MEERLKRVNGENAKCLVRTTIAQYVIQKGDLPRAKEILDSVSSEIEKLDSTDSSVYAKFYHVFTSYYKVRKQSCNLFSDVLESYIHLLFTQRIGSASQFYKNGLLYLAYVQAENISLQEQKTLSVDLIVSSLIAEDTYIFGELVAQPILQSLQGTEDAWLVDLLHAFNSGDIRRYQQVLENNKAGLSSRKDLQEKSQFLSEKISILSLIELIFTRPAQNRNISFREIAQASFLKTDEVEILVMRALSVGLIKGEIDEVSQVVSIDWVIPRVLNLQQIETLKGKIDGWRDHVNKTLNVLEDNTQELLV